MYSLNIIKINETFWQSMLSPKTSWSTLFLEWADTFLILTALLFILWKLAFLNLRRNSLAQQKQKSIELCHMASIVTLFAGLLPIIRVSLLPESPFFHEIFKAGVLLTAAFILSNSEQFIVKHPERPILEYSFFVLTGVSFLLLLIESDDLITLFLNLLGFSLSLYVLIMIFWSEIKGSYSRSVFQVQANYRFEPFEQAHEASLKYFYLSAFSSALILLSITIFYSLTQTVSFDELQVILNMNKLGGTSFHWISVWEEIFWLALALYIIGFAFKLSAWPSHYWAPEVYQGAASPVTAFILMPVKIAVFAIFARTLVTVFDSLHYLWGSLLLFFGLGSLVVGAFGALTERVFKKFIAYSSINQIGYLLIGLSTGQLIGLQTVMFFFIVYIITTLVLFAVFLNLQSSLTGEHLRYISELSFLSPHEWLPRAALTVVFFSLAGLPPFAGFFSKFYLLLHLFEKGSILAVFIGIATSLISAYYYLTLVNYMWFGSVPKASRKKTNFIFPVYQTQWKNSTVSTLYVGLAFLTLYIFVNAPFLNFCYSLAQSCAYFSKGITLLN